MTTQPYEVESPIICSPFEEPTHHWHIVEGEPLEKRDGRRRAVYYYRPPRASLGDAGKPVDLALVNELRARVKRWREAAYPGVTRTTLDLLRYWRREGREKRFFFAQLEAAETIIFLVEARHDFRQGIDIPPDDPSEDRRAQGYTGFERLAAKMATGSGKTAVMGMLIAWSVLNKLNARGDRRFSDTILVVCPNVTIRDRLGELYPERAEASIYRTRDIVPESQMPALRQGRVKVVNWHDFERKQVAKARVDTRGAESDTAVVERVMSGAKGKQNVLVINDEAHHAYRIIPRETAEPDEDLDADERDEADRGRKEATVWIDGLDMLHRIRGINRCIDLSATPYYFDRVSDEDPEGERSANRPFPWVVSDFSLTDAIESGLVKIPQLAVRDTTGARNPAYFNIWAWILPQLTAAERGGRHGVPRPEAVLKWALHPLQIAANDYEEAFREWEAGPGERHTPPVFIVVCKNTKLADVVFKWLSGQETPSGIPPSTIETLRNGGGERRTIRVDSKVIEEMERGEGDTGTGSQAEERRWMRFTLDTVGTAAWHVDSQGRPQYPEGFQELAAKLNRPLHPPGRDVRCIVSVGMLTEGWDCRTVTHIVGLRPFQSQLLCEQVVGRGLRRTSYAEGEDGLFAEEIAQVLGVPFEIIPFKTARGQPSKPAQRTHIRALEERGRYRIEFPRVEGYAAAPRARIAVNWDQVPVAYLDPERIPPEVETKATLPNNSGRPALHGPGRLTGLNLDQWRASQRVQALEFQLAATLTRDVARVAPVPPHALFSQLQPIVSRYLRERVEVRGGADLRDIFLSPYYGWAIEKLADAIRPDTGSGESPEFPRYESHRGPGSSSDVDFWTGKRPDYLREAIRTHLNFVVCDTRAWEQEAAYYLDTHANVGAFVKNAGLGFAVPYIDNGEQHDFQVDYIVRLAKDGGVLGHLLLEPKGYDRRAEVKEAAARRWCSAVNAEGSYGRWTFRMVRTITAVPAAIDDAVAELAAP